MNASDALLKSYYDALNGVVSLPVYSAPPTETTIGYVYIAFDSGGNDGSKSGKIYRKQISIEAHIPTDNYSAGRKAANDALEEVEAAVWPTVGSVVDMTLNGYRMITQDLADQGADDTLYSVERIVRVFCIFEVTFELI